MMEDNVDKMLKKLKENREEFMKESRKRTREVNKLAREMGYPRGVKQMKEEGVL